MKNIVDFTSKIKEKFTMRKDIAPVEGSSTASRAYSAGDKFYYGNLLQKAITDIAQGAAFVGGTNFENADPVTTTIQNLSNYVNNDIYYNGAKNLLPLLISKIKAINTAGTWSTSGGNDVYTINAVTFTITSNADGFITNIKVNGTNPSGTTSDLIIIEKNTRDAFAMYDLVKGYSLVGATHAGVNVHFILDGQLNNAWKTVQAFSGKQDISLDISTSNNVRICLRTPASSTVSNENVKPILGFKSIMDSDDSFVPYALTNRQLTINKVGMDLLSEVGAVNFSTTDITTQTVINYTFTVNSDKTITVSGTSSVKEEVKWDLYLPSGTYRLSGCPDGGSLDTYRITVRPDLGGNEFLHDVGEGVVFTVNGSVTTRVYITINNGNSQNYSINKTFKPMVAPVDYTGPYVPYAKSNKELTENVTNQLGNATLAGTYLGDCNNVASSGTLNLYGATSSTANSPYTAGVETSANSFVILSRVDTNTNWGMQLAIPMTSVKGIYMRFKASGTWGTWSKITP